MKKNSHNHNYEKEVRQKYEQKIAYKMPNIHCHA
jgi:hypothetical protein